MNEEFLLSRSVKNQAARKLKARAKSSDSVWLGLGMSGLVGWTVAVPTIGGAGLGIWIDTYHRTPFSWTLMMMLGGLVLGCLNAWHWVSREDAKIHEEHDE
jgi:ATP synthase protein I